MKASNRLLGFFILVIIFAIIFFFYFFLHKNPTQLKIISNTTNFSGQINTINFSKNFDCINKECFIYNLYPLKYNIILTKTGFLDIKQKIILNKKNNILNINFQKKIEFIKVNKKRNTRNNLIEKINNNKKNNILYLGKKIKFTNILNEKNYIYLQKNNELVFYNLKNKNSFSIKFKPNIEYIKKTKNNIFIIKTTLGSFKFNIINKNIDYSPIFNDYILYKGIYIGIINSKDNQKKENLGFKQKKGNLIILYNSQNKEKRILKQFDTKIEKIYIENNKIFIQIFDKNKYEILGLN